MNHQIKIFFIAIIVFAVSCQLKKQNTQYESVNEAGWKAQDTISFVVNIEDISKKHQLSVAVRYNKSYEFNNFWIKICQQKPKEKIIFSNIEIPLFNHIGKPYGKCTGSLCTQIFPIEKNIVFKNKGKYKIKIIHLMRQEPLFGIKDIGVVLE